MVVGLDAEDNKTQQQLRKPPSIFSPGSEVEVRSDEEGFRGSWFIATIITISSTFKVKKKALVKYKSLVTDDGADNLKELADLDNLRPLPPEISDQKFEEGVVVDADYEDGWWTGVVQKVLENSRYSVFFENPPHVINFEQSKLRVHQDWVDSKWVLPPKLIITAEKGGYLDNVGTKAVPRKGGRRNVKSPVTENSGPKVGAAEKDGSKVDGIVKECEVLTLSASKRSRHTPARRRSGQLPNGEVHKTVRDQKKDSIDQSEDKRMETKQQKVSGTSNKRKRGRPCKLIIRSSGEGKQQNGAENVTGQMIDEDCINALPLVSEVGPKTDVQDTLERKKGTRSRNTTKEVVVAQGRASNYVDDDDQPLSLWFGEKMQSGSRESRQPAATTTTTIDQKNKPIGLKANNNMLGENQGSPFMKSSPIWNAIESMEVFMIMPQNPHFRPLDTFKEEYREGLAIGNMVTFASLVEKISKLRFDDPRSVFDSTLESLVDLEKHGFDVTVLRNRVNELILITDKQKQYTVVSVDLQSRISENTQEKGKLSEEIEDLAKKITELEKKRALLKSEMKVKDGEISRLQSRLKLVNEGRENSRAKFGKLASTPFKPALVLSPS